MAKFKIKKDKKKSAQKGTVKKSPRNYRIIPEKWNRDEVAFFAGAVFILLAILFITVNLFSNINEENKLANKKIALTRQELFWKDQVRDKPDFRDAYFSLALVEFQLKNMEAAKQNVEKALAIDPNFKEGKELQIKISGE